MSIKIFLKNKIKGDSKKKGFILPMTLVVCSIILAISSGISIILLQGMLFSRLSRSSQIAYYTADVGMMCAISIDDSFVDSQTGIGIFPYDPNEVITATSTLGNISGTDNGTVNFWRVADGLPGLALSDVKCASAPMFASSAEFKVEPFSRLLKDGITTENGKSSTFKMKIDFSDGTYRCAVVTVSKTSSYRRIISRGLTSCTNTGSFVLERAIVNITQEN